MFDFPKLIIILLVIVSLFNLHYEIKEVLCYISIVLIVIHDVILHIIYIIKNDDRRHLVYI
jgi:hypothetical protein